MRKIAWPGAATALLSLSLSSTLCVGSARAAQCGTAILFQHRGGLGTGSAAGAAKSPVAARVQAALPWARTYETDHFIIHYSLTGVYKVRLAAEDAALIHAADSLFARFSALADRQRDSSVYAALDSMGMPHPLYVQKVRTYFEAARAYYVDKLGMLAPVGQVLSKQYAVPSSLPHKFAIDIVDVGSADAEFEGPTYAVTYPPNDLSITFENDFQYETFNGAGVAWAPIQAKVNGQIIHDYTVDWELGIKVTAFHEFYHAVQFTYTPDVQNYHAWYELSATGMEERNASEVNDYIQYLPCVLYNHTSVGLLSTDQGPCTHLPMYGQSIFHQYLSKTLDSSFDVKVWSRLRANNDALQDGLQTAFAAYGRSMNDLYPDYTAQTFFAGKRFVAPAGLYSSDMPLWPDAAIDSVDLTAPSLYRSITLTPQTFSILKIKWGANASPRTFQAKVATGIARIHAGKDTSIVEKLDQTQFSLGAPKDGFNAYYLVVPNPSFTQDATIEIKDQDASFYAFPNPVRSIATAYFSSPKGLTFPATVRVYGEDGRQVRALSFAGADQSFAWDLRDETAHAVKPGLYYYRLGGDSLQTLIVVR